MKNLKKRLKNPTTAGVLATLAVVAAGGGTAWYFLKKDKAAKKKKKKTTSTTEDAAIDESDETKDTSATEDEKYGLVFREDCSDFDVVEPPDDVKAFQTSQGKILTDALALAMADGPVDPHALAAVVLNEISPDSCEFPPSPDAPPRIVQLYLYISALMATLALGEGGSVEGFTASDPLDPAQLDAHLAGKTAVLGYPAFDASVIPDLLPDVPEPPQVGFDPLVASVEALVPDTILAQFDLADIYAQGDFPGGTELQLLHSDTLAPIQELTQALQSPGVIRLSVKGVPGLYVLYVRPSPASAWEETGKTLKVEALTTGFQPAS